MLSVINPSQIQPGGHSTFPRPANPVSHNLSSSYNNISSTSSSNNSRIGHTISCNVSAFPVNSNFQARSSSTSVGDNIRNHNMIFASSNSNSFNPTTSSRAPELFHFSSSKHSTCSTTSSSSSVSSSSRRGMMSQNMFSNKQSWNNASQIFHPGYRNGFSSNLNGNHHLMPHSSTSSACWLDCLSSNSSEKVSSSASYPLSSQRRMSTNSSINMGYNHLQQCTPTSSRLHHEQDELEKVRKRLSVNNSLFCNPSTSRVTNRPLPQPDGSSSKDFTKTLFVDCSIEYELPNAPKIPKNSDPILMIHPVSKSRKVSSDGNSAHNMSRASTSRSIFIKEEQQENERAFKLEFENSGASKLCSSSKCSCPEAVQYRKKYRLHLDQQKRQQQKSFVKKEVEVNDSNNGDNQIDGTSLKGYHHQERSSSVLQSGCKRSYAQALNDDTRGASKDNLTSAFQHPTSSSNSDCSGLYSGNNSNSGRNNFNPLQRMQIDHLRNSSRSGKNKFRIK